MILAAALLFAGLQEAPRPPSLYFVYRACLKEEALKVDDGRTDVTVILEVALHECEVLRAGMAKQISESVRAKNPDFTEDRAGNLATKVTEHFDQSLRPEILRHILLTRKSRQ